VNGLTEKRREILDREIRKTYWSGPPPLERFLAWWRNPRRHAAMLRAALTYMDPMALLRFAMGSEWLVRHWPDLREGFSESDPLETQARDVWDALWGAYAVGDSQYPAHLMRTVAHLGKARRRLLREIVVEPGLSVYALAKRLRRDYSRVYKDVRLLETLGLVETREARTPQGRRQRLCFACDTVGKDLYFLRVQHGTPKNPSPARSQAEQMTAPPRILREPPQPSP